MLWESAIILEASKCNMHAANVAASLLEQRRSLQLTAIRSESSGKVAGPVSRCVLSGMDSAQISMGTQQHGMQQGEH